MNKNESLKVALIGYRQALIDTKQIVEEIFDKSIDFYNQKLKELDNIEEGISK